MNSFKEPSPEPSKDNSSLKAKKSKEVSALDIYQQEYRPARRAVLKQNSIDNQERLEIKSRIADAIRSGDSTLLDHFLKLQERIDRGQRETGMEFASRISDSSLSSAKREPSLVEAVLVTEEFDKIYKEVSEAFGKDVLEVMRIGSSFWGRNYSIRGTERADPSDIDLEIIVDAVPEGLPYSETEKTLAEFKKYFLSGEADFCAIKLVIRGVEVSFHITPLKTFQKICEFDYTKADQPAFLREFRATTEEKPKTYKQRNFAGDQFHFSTKPKLVEGGQISEVPLVIMGPKGELVLGVVLNKYLPLPELGRQNGTVHAKLNELVDSLRVRKNLDQERMPGTPLSFTKFHSHSERMPQWMKDELKTLD